MNDVYISLYQTDLVFVILSNSLTQVIRKKASLNVYKAYTVWGVYK